MKQPQIAVLVYTYNKIHDARINMEIIRNQWVTNPMLREIILVHAFNGQKEWWPEKYLEDELIYLDNPGHFTGAALLMDEGLKLISVKYPNINHGIVLAADTWMVQPEFYAEGPQLGLIELGLTLGFIGVFGLAVFRFLAKYNIVAIGDPRLAESVFHHHQ